MLWDLVCSQTLGTQIPKRENIHNWGDLCKKGGEKKKKKKKEQTSEEIEIPTWSFCCTSILYPGGKNVLKPTISSGWPLKRSDTLAITPGVSILWDLNSFMISKKSLYTWGWFPNLNLTWSKYDKASSTLSFWNCCWDCWEGCWGGTVTVGGVVAPVCTCTIIKIEA